MIKNIFSQKGQGLLEAVFAIGILLIVAGAILALSTSNVVGQKSSEFQIRANNLAREGIEVVRSIRDTNWLDGSAWDSGLVGQTAIAEFDTSTPSGSWQLNFIYVDSTLYLDLSTGIHSHEASGTATIFQRDLEFQDICLESSGAEVIEDVCSTGEKIGLEVTSIIKWNKRGQNREISLVDLLYAWK